MKIILIVFRKQQLSNFTASCIFSPYFPMANTIQVTESILTSIYLTMVKE